jgi:hypothetical protein
MRKTMNKSKLEGATRHEQLAGTTALGISLDARGVVAGIAFHLVDEGLAERVCPDSARRTVGRITAGGTGAVEVSRSLWEEMSNAERLAWLLAGSGTEFQVGSDGVARLKARGG